MLVLSDVPDDRIIQYADAVNVDLIAGLEQPPAVAVDWVGRFAQRLETKRWDRTTCRLW
jgi:hypothetical protein